MSDQVFSRLARSFLPSTAVLEMTYRCNHRCIFCSCPWEAENGIFPIEKEWSFKDWKKCIATLVKMGVTSIAFTGGEPLLNPHIAELIQFAAGCESEHIETVDKHLESRMAPPKLYLLTNGTSVNEDILKLCRKYNVHLSMSLPGLTTFTEHTQAGNPQTILDWFKKAHDLGIATTVNVTVTRKNIGELFETISSALIAGADTLLMNRFLPGGRGLHYANELSLNPRQIVEMLDTAEDILKKANRYGTVGTELPKCLLDTSRYQHLEVGTRCSAGLDFFVVDPSGYVRVCNHSQVRLNHFREIEKVKVHPYWQTFIKKDYMPHKCLDCPDMIHCDGGCREAAHIVRGNLDGVDPVLSP